MSTNLTNILRHRVVVDSNLREPEFFRISNDQDSNALQLLLEANPQIQVIDSIESQIKDLIKLRNPSRSLNEIDFLLEQNKILQGASLENYGVWIYYPWNYRLLHLLDEPEFIEVRTIRNRYKISQREQSELSNKTIGVIGLSVGQSACLALALERVCGHLKIADFDDLELSNLNRIRSGIHNIGIKKTTIIAREIAEIDPFLKVTCYDNGITDSNIDAFFEDNGKIDLLIEECDSVDIKILARKEAKKRGLPVLMDTSDRGMMDIERFDLDKKYPILHGLIDEKWDLNILKNLKSSEDKLPYILPIISIETLSSRFKASGIEIGKQITTWPQLAGEVILGGALCSNLAKRILLGHNIPSQRAFFDIEAIIPTTQPGQRELIRYENKLSLEKAISIINQLSIEEAGYNLENSTLEEIMDAALAAPSAGNNQKWKWIWQNNVLYAFIDKDENYAFGDNLNLASYINMGCALENISLKCKSLNYEPKIIFNIKPNNFPLVAHVTFHRSEFKLDPKVLDLSSKIFTRGTNRSKQCLKPITISDCNIMSSDWNSDNSQIEFIIDEDKIKEIAKLVCKGDRFRFTNIQGHQEFFQKEIRWNNEEAEITRDGLDINLLELSLSDRTGLTIAKDIEAIEHLISFNGGAGFEKISEKTFFPGSAIGIVYADNYSIQTLLKAGMEIERNWLLAELSEIAVYPVTVLPMMFTFLDNDEHKFNSPQQLSELKNIKLEFDKCLPQLKNKKILYFVRYSHSPRPIHTSKRKDNKEKFFSL